MWTVEYTHTTVSFKFIKVNCTVNFRGTCRLNFCCCHTPHKPFWSITTLPCVRLYKMQHSLNANHKRKLYLCIGKIQFKKTHVKISNNLLQTNTWCLHYDYNSIKHRRCHKNVTPTETQTNIGHFCLRSQERCMETQSSRSVLLTFLAFLGAFQFRNSRNIQENIM